MTPRVSLWTAGLIAALAGAAFAWSVRLPLPFEGFAILAAAGLAGFGTLALLAWSPRGWLWSDAEQLHHAFQARHGTSAAAAASALEAITQAHLRALTLRRAATAMRKDVAEEVAGIADRMDAAAREIFYAPERQRDLRAVLVRSDLIVDAAAAHAALRRRKSAPIEEEAARTKLLAAVAALDAAFDETELLAARGLLADVEVASTVAEAVLTPRRAAKAKELMNTAP